MKNTCLNMHARQLATLILVISLPRGLFLELTTLPVHPRGLSQRQHHLKNTCQHHNKRKPFYGIVAVIRYIHSNPRCRFGHCASCMHLGSKSDLTCRPSSKVIYYHSCATILDSRHCSHNCGRDEIQPTFSTTTSGCSKRNGVYETASTRGRVDGEDCCAKKESRI